MKINHRLLTSEEKLTFRSKYMERANGAISEEYLEKSLVRGFFNEKSMIGGYIVNANAPLRYLTYIPSEQLPRFEKFIGSSCEITCIWMDRTFNVFEALILYLMCLIDSYKSKKKYILGGTTNAKVKRIQKAVLGRDLWEGINTNPAINQMQWIYYEKTSLVFQNFILRLVLIYPFLRAKSYIKRRFRAPSTLTYE